MHSSATTLTLRPFGELSDLDVNFTDADRPALVTALLTHCIAPYDAAFWWAQSLSNRIAALLRLVITTSGRCAVELTSRCMQPVCQSTFEFELPLDSLVGQPFQENLIEVALGEGRQVVLRRPMGED